MAPCTWMAFFAASMAASAQAMRAWETCSAACGLPSASDWPARYSGPLANSMSTATLAIRCLTAWNEPIGLPNCLRSKL
ncbi:hypothetical protein D3C78_1820270 [compost metagenome]